MKAIILSGIIASLTTIRAFGVLAVPGTLADYIALGPGGATIGSTLFSDFTLLPLQNFATGIPANSILVTPINLSGNPALEFTLNQTALSGELFEMRLSYKVSDFAITGASVGLNLPSAIGDAAITGILDVSGPIPKPPTLIAFEIAGISGPTDQTTFPSTGVLTVETDVVVDGGTQGTGSLRSATNQFVVAPIPEPATFGFGLALLGICAVSYWRRSNSVRRITNLAALTAVAVVAAPQAGHAANHREAPITALDHKADITDVYAFRSYDGNATPRVTMILCVDPFLEPGNGPNWFPFDPEILYEIKVDNNNDAVADITFQFRFTTEQRLPNLFQVYAGAGAGISAPPNSPSPVPPGTPIVPPRIISFSDVGLGQRQAYSVTMVKGGVSTPIAGAGPLYAVPANVGPRTMDYPALFAAGTYTTTTPNVKVFAGTTDDAFWIDLGAAFDTLNLRAVVNGGVLTPAQDAAAANVASDTVSGYGVNSLAIEVPVSLLTRTGAVEAANSTAATIGVWATTSRPRVTVRQSPFPQQSSGVWRQVQRMGNPLINELLVGTGFKDRFSMDEPKNDSQFASFFLDPALARVLNAATAGALSIPTPPRLDLLPLVTYAPPIAAPGTTAGPVADLLRLNTGVPPTAPASASRLGLLGGDAAGYPNGRRVFDDVTDISLRAVAGVLNPAFNIVPNNRLGDGVNVNDALYRTTFPYLADCPSGRDRRHLDPGEPGGGAP